MFYFPKIARAHTLSYFWKNFHSPDGFCVFCLSAKITIFLANYVTVLRRFWGKRRRRKMDSPFEKIIFCHLITENLLLINRLVVKNCARSLTQLFLWNFQSAWGLGCSSLRTKNIHFQAIFWVAGEVSFRKKSWVIMIFPFKKNIFWTLIPENMLFTNRLVPKNCASAFTKIFFEKISISFQITIFFLRTEIKAFF